MARLFAAGIAVVVCLCMGAGVAVAREGGGGPFAPGAPGIGDPYFPLDGNGGYDVAHYSLDLSYDPATDELAGTAKLRATATQNLSSFNLDLSGLEVLSVRVDGRSATFTRDGAELTVTPQRGIKAHRRFTVAVTYHGVPETIEEFGGPSGFIHTDDGALVAGQPDAAATWFPVNDHPLDKASYSFRITVPDGLKVVANGVLKGRRSHDGSTTWSWEAREPMASYLTTLAIGDFDVRSYTAGGLRYWDAIDPDLFDPFAPRTGEGFALTGFDNQSYKRLTRTITVPAGGAQLSFWVQRDTEPQWDYMFVEAHAAGSDVWTTLPDLNGHTNTEPGVGCAVVLGEHPFMAHYQTANEDGTCAPTGSTGTWNGVSGASQGYEHWTVDLSGYAGGDVEVSISYASDDLFNYSGLFLDDVEVSTGEGSTSFEDDGDTLDGWTVPGAPEGSIPNTGDWRAGTAADAPPPPGEAVESAFARQPEIIGFLSGIFGPYPFSAAGGIVDHNVDIGFALETQTRPVYSLAFFADRIDPSSGPAVLVHEITHQWFGDSLALARWQHIWLNEGFASYAEWLWSEREGLGTAQEIFDSRAAIPADDPFWTVTIGDPGPDLLFDIAVYERGAMTLHALRQEVGDADFFRILRRWAQSREGGNVTTPEFIALAERISGEQLDDFFQTWLFTPAKPAGIEPPAAEARSQAVRTQALERSRKR